ncbi:MAG: T9SS type A sorting domain-containing protein [Bacteroidota bacterium]
MKTTLSCISAMLFCLSMYAQNSIPLFIPSDTSICVDDTVFFTNRYPDLCGYTYHWDFGDGNMDTTSMHTQHVYTAADTFPASLTIQGDSFIYILRSFTFHSFKTSLWYTWPVDVKPDPYITVSGSQCSQHNFSTNPHQQLNVTLPYTIYPNRALGLQSYTVNVWDRDQVGGHDFIDNVTLNIPGGSGSFSNINMTVSWVIDSIPLTPPYSRDIIADYGPTPPVIVGPDTVCDGESFTLIAQSDSGLIYQWYEDGTPIPNATDDTLEYSISILNLHTTRHFTVEAIDPTGGCQPSSEEFNVLVIGMPHGVFGTGPGNGSLFCEGDTVTLATYSHALYQLQWFKDSVAVPGQTSKTYSITETGTYFVQISREGCVKFGPARTITFFPNDPILISPPGNQILCQGDTFVLYPPPTPIPPTAYRWYNGSQVLWGKPLDSLIITQTGDYWLTWWSPCGKDSSQHIQVTMMSAPAAPNISGPVSMPCQGSTALLSFQPDSGVFYQWQRNGVNLPGETSSSLNTNQDGQYQVIATNSNFCQKISTPFDLQFGVVPPVPTVQVTASTPLCEGDAAILGTNVSNVSYQWHRDGLPISGAIQNQYLAATSGTYHLQVSSVSQCSSESDTVSIQVWPKPVAPWIRIEVGEDSSFCHGEDLILELFTPESNLTIQWYLDNISIPHASEDSFFASSGGTYHATVTNSHGCQAASQSIILNSIASPSPMIDKLGNDTLYTMSTYDSYVWMLEGTDSVLASGPYFVPSQSGNYVVQVDSSNGCSGISLAFYFTITDLEDVAQLSIKLYPNPSQGQTYLDLPSLQHEAILEVFDLRGRRMLQTAYSPAESGQRQSLNLPQASDGVYIVRLTTTGYQPWTRKWIIRQ